MSTHPNAMLICVFTPDDLARKTYRAIIEEAGIGPDDTFKLGDKHFGGGFSHRVMEDDYNEAYQISAPEGSIVFHTFLTYGYGEKAAWSEVQSAKDALDDWAKGVCERHNCKAEIFIGANYW